MRSRFWITLVLTFVLAGCFGDIRPLPPTPTPTPPPVEEPPAPTPTPTPTPEPTPTPTPEPPPPPDPDPTPEPEPPGHLHPTFDQVTFLHRPSVVTWSETSTILDVTFDGEFIEFPHTMAGRWPTWTDPDGSVGEGNVWVFGQVNGRWYAATAEWLRPGQVRKRLTACCEWGIGPHTKREPLESWVPQPGEWIGIMVSGRARDSGFSVEERSQVFWVQWAGDDGR